MSFISRLIRRVTGETRRGDPAPRTGTEGTSARSGAVQSAIRRFTGGRG